jgi:predicted metalloprotease
MRWEQGRRSENVEDRRGMRVSRGVAGGGIGTIILVLVALYFGVDPSIILNQNPLQTPEPHSQSAPYSGSPEENRLAEFVSVVLADTEDTWRELFRSMGKTYEEPSLVIFSGAVQSACGTSVHDPSGKQQAPGGCGLRLTFGRPGSAPSRAACRG